MMTKQLTKQLENTKGLVGDILWKYGYSPEIITDSTLQKAYEEYGDDFLTDVLTAVQGDFSNFSVPIFDPTGLNTFAEKASNQPSGVEKFLSGALGYIDQGADIFNKFRSGSTVNPAYGIDPNNYVQAPVVQTEKTEKSSNTTMILIVVAVLVAVALVVFLKKK